MADEAGSSGDDEKREGNKEKGDEVKKRRRRPKKESKTKQQENKGLMNYLEKGNIMGFEVSFSKGRRLEHSPVRKFRLTDGEVDTDNTDSKIFSDENINVTDERTESTSEKINQLKVKNNDRKEEKAGNNINEKEEEAIAQENSHEESKEGRNLWALKDTTKARRGKQQEKDGKPTTIDEPTESAKEGISKGTDEEKRNAATAISKEVRVWMCGRMSELEVRLEQAKTKKNSIINELNAIKEQEH